MDIGQHRVNRFESRVEAHPIESVPGFTDRLIVEPDDGLEPVREFIRTTEESQLIKQFTFTEETLIQEVINRHNRGVDVRLLLNPQRSGGDRANDAAYEYFKSAGINVQWSSPKFYVTHEKSIVADKKAALVSTFNLRATDFSIAVKFSQPDSPLAC
jgi:phosphatidylserine/phosphatidylglycerophosphate/cardiolipin synthase-like enzyme